MSLVRCLDSLIGEAPSEPSPLCWAELELVERFTIAR
jgi:hypothetical protein